MKTLEDILSILGSENPFLLEVEVDEDGHRQPFKGITFDSEELYSLYEILKTMNEDESEDD